MIPFNLKLRNFMCYRGSENEVDFAGIHLACLAGDNGQGKSALLDAITWALWGRARARRDDDLISFGELEMEVQLEFGLGGGRYRVIRRRNASGRGSSVLELQGRTGDGFFAPLTEPTIRETQKKINELLRLDYDTFINSAFLIQGRADEFTTRKPAERKQILGEILSLGEYDLYSERARARARAAEQRRAALEQELERIRAEVARIPELEAELITAEEDARTLERETREADLELQTLLEQRRELDAKADQLTDAERRATAARGEIARAAERADAQRTRLARIDALLERADEIDAAQRELAGARAERERWDELLQQSHELETASNALRHAIERARDALQGELRAAEREIERHRARLDRFRSREQELGEALRKVEILEALVAERDRRQQTLAEWAEADGRLKAENARLREAMDVQKERLELLEESPDADCPLCRRPLSDEARADALETLHREGTEMGDRFRANLAERQKVADEIARLREQLASDERQLRELSSWQRRAVEASQAAEEMRLARDGLDGAEREATTIRARLESDDYAREEQAQLAETAGRSESLGYDRAAHDQARATIQRLAPRQQEFDELHAAREGREQVAVALEALEESHRHWRGELERAEADIARLGDELAQRAAIVQQCADRQRVVGELKSRLTQANRHVGGVKQRLQYAEAHAAREPDVARDYQTAIEERTTYEQLAQSFGKRGLQAMIIESAIPEIESEANTLLDRMSDGKMSVALHTQRESRSGDAIETLDIVIADENGERPYETFSGGEAFRVNFALRIALSKLLAHRAGTSLRTLVIDEGFGSQDSRGRDRLVEAITTVQEDFDRILVITHIEELKDAFPVRIDIVKNADGSRVVMA